VFEPTIEFRYAFRERQYIGHRVAFGDVASGSRAAAEGVVERFAVGTQWEVSICERRPDLSVLHPGPTGRLWFTVAFFVVYTLLAVSFLLDSVQRFRG
jgi:hypothetical protein